MSARPDPAASKDPLLQPLRIGHVTFRNRVMSTSHACGLEEGGMPTDAYQSYHEEKARGGIALTMFGGSSNVAPDSPSVFRQLNVGTDAIIPHLQRFSERVHAQGAALMCQITHLGRRGENYADNWLPLVAPSPIRETLHRAIPKEMDEHDIARIVKAYGAAAKRCQEGGLDGIETLTSAHLIGQFLSPLTNKRTDKYGGSLENRCRFGLMVMEEIRRAVADAPFLVGLRFIVDEGPDGLGFDECLEIARVFEASGTIDFFNAIHGRMDTELALAVDNMPGMASPLAPWLDPVGRFKQAVGLPVFHAARISDVATARHAIREGLLDMVAMTRAHIADPHLVRKLAASREEEIRPCVGATHCMSPQRPKCLHNAVTGREPTLPHEIPRSDNPGREVLVVGAGPAGLEAARVAAERGHVVTVLEAAPRPGGQVLLAASASWRRDLMGVIDWRVAELERLGATLRCDVYAEPADVRAENPEIVIIATGGMPDLDWLEGGALCLGAWDVLGAATPGEQILVYDGTGRHVAATAAERLKGQGKQVDYVAIDGSPLPEMTYAERAVWKRRLYGLDIPVSLDRRLVRVAREGNRLAATLVNELTGQTETRIADQVVVEQGTQPADELFHALRAASANDGVTDLDALLARRAQPFALGPDKPFQLHRIGDAVASRNIPTAVLDGLRLCLTF